MYIQKVANDFVREYYTRLYSSPSTLCELYAEDASLVHGNEGDDKELLTPIKKEVNIKDLLNREGFGNSKVRITDVTAVQVDASIVSVLVLGDMKQGEAHSKMFIQSFVLRYDQQGGHLVLTDLLRFPQQESSNPEFAAVTPIKETASSLKPPNQTSKEKESLAPQNNSTEAPNSALTSPSDSSDSMGTPLSASAEPPSKPSKPSEMPSEEPVEKTEKARKFKFSFDTIAKAPSFRPKNSAPTYPMNYAMGGISPSYPTSPAYQGMHPPMHVPLQYALPQMIPQGNFMPPMQNPHIPRYRENSSP